MDAFLQLLQRYQYFGLVAFLAAVFFTPVAIRLAFRTGVLDRPDTKLKPHLRPTPYLGGTAICLGWALALLLAMATGVASVEVLGPILLGGVALSVMGLIDDVRNISPKVRLLVGAAVIALVLLSTQSGLMSVHSLLKPIGIHLPPAVSAAMSLVISIVIVLGACNSTNLIDGLDGLCSGVTAIISLGFFLLAAHLALGRWSEVGDPVRLVLAIAMFGAAMGFLPWNFKPAKIFMGDAGSVLLGYNCGMMIVLFSGRGMPESGDERGIIRWALGALAIFGLPIFDTSLAMFRRFRSGRSIFEGDRSHFYDQLVQRGLSVRQTVLVCYAVALAYAAIGLTVIWIRTYKALIAFVGVALLSALLAYLAGLTNPEEKKEFKLDR